jgi:hypothetical protein
MKGALALFLHANLTLAWTIFISHFLIVFFSFRIQKLGYFFPCMWNII